MDGRMKAVIDADFFRNITEHEQKSDLFLQVMTDLGMKPVMHEFVAKVELQGNVYLQKLLDEGFITIISYEDYLNKENKEEYEEYFREAYERINRFDFPERHNIYEYAERGESLGEIRSLYMARKMGYIYFMSDDADAKVLAKSFFSSKSAVQVLSLYDALVMCKKSTKLRWKDINPTVTKAMRKRQDKVNTLKKLYSE